MIEDLFDFDENEKGEFEFVIGTDEAGRGPGAGPVFAAAVCFTKRNKKIEKLLEKLNDSKKLTEKVREELFPIIVENSVHAVKFSTVEEIEKINILNASLKSMKLACEEVIKTLNSTNTTVLVDGNRLIKNFKYPQKFVIKGDSKSASIAAASILAKVSRDRYMKELSKNFPEYDFEHNKGYLTAKHLEAVDKYGLTPHHRKKFLEKHFTKQTTLPL